MAKRMLNSGLSAHRPRRYTRSVPQPASEVPEDLTKIDDLLDWVDSDPERAQAVMEQENEKPEKHRRKTLVTQLAEIILEG